MEHHREPKPFLNRNIYALGAVSFLNDVSSEIIYPLLPIFLTATLKASVAFVGVIEGIAETTSSVLKLISGWLSDKMGKRKALVSSGYTLSALTRPLVALAMHPYQVLLLRFSDRVGKGVRTSPRDALISDSCSPSERGRAFGFHRAMDHAGAFTGALIAFFLLLSVGDNFRFIFLIAAIPGIFSLLVIWLYIKEIKPKQAVLGATSPKAKFDPNFKIFIFTVFIFSLGNSSDAFLILRARDFEFSLIYIPLLWIALHCGKTVSSLPGGMLSDKIGRKRVIIAGWILYALVYAGFAYAPSQWAIWLLFFSYGFFFGFTESVERAFVADLAGESARGSAFGTYNFITGISALPASILMGFLWQEFGATFAFLFEAVIAVFATILFLAFVRET